MATIELRAGKYRAMIRKKNKQMFATFSDKSIAEMWSRYHEDLIDNLENFQVPPENLITLESCVDLKLEECKERNLPQRTISDYENIKSEFKSLMDIPLGELTADAIKIVAQEKSQEIVRKGGFSANNTGSLRVSSPATLLRKLRCLAAVIGFMIEKGANIKNPAQVVVNQVKMSIIKRGESLEENDDE